MGDRRWPQKFSGIGDRWRIGRISHREVKRVEFGGRNSVSLRWTGIGTVNERPSLQRDVNATSIGAADGESRTCHSKIDTNTLTFDGKGEELWQG
jgi:hypothetical protein